MIHICPNGHLTGFRYCPMCSPHVGNSFLIPRRELTAKGTDSRQQRRRRAWREHVRVVNYFNLKPMNDGRHIGMPRRERRKLARAYAKGLARKATA